MWKISWLILILIIFSFNRAEAATECCGYSDPNNTYPCSGGNCTWWAAYKRPETNFPGSGRDAKYWLDLAEQNNLPIGSRPKKGSIAVFENFYPSYGHVAYVESVSNDTFTVTEMCWTGCFGWCQVRNHTYSIAEATGFIFPEDGSVADDKPDLRIHQLTINKINQQLAQYLVLLPNEPFEITVTVKNKGDGDADSKFYVKYLISSNDSFSSGDSGIADDTGDDDDSIQSLDAGDEDDESIVVRAPSEPGTYYIGAWADSKDDIDEEDEDNNFSDSDDEIGEIIVKPPVPTELVMAIVSTIIAAPSSYDPDKEVSPRDPSGDTYFTILDAIMALQVTCGMDVDLPQAPNRIDISGDDKVGLEEAVFTLQKVAAMRQ